MPDCLGQLFLADVDVTVIVQRHDTNLNQAHQRSRLVVAAPERALENSPLGQSHVDSGDGAFAQSARCSRKIAITLGTAARINNCGIRNTISAPTITTRMIKTVSDMTVRIGLSDSKTLDYIAPRFVLLALAFQGRRRLTAGNRPNSGRDHKKRVATIPTQLSSRRTS